MSKEKPQLLPCPKCWSRDVRRGMIGSVNPDRSGHFVMCGQCEHESPLKPTETEATDAWNAASVDPQKVMDVAREMARALKATEKQVVFRNLECQVLSRAALARAREAGIEVGE